MDSVINPDEQLTYQKLNDCNHDADDLYVVSFGTSRIRTRLYYTGGINSSGSANTSSLPENAALYCCADAEMVAEILNHNLEQYWIFVKPSDENGCYSVRNFKDEMQRVNDYRKKESERITGRLKFIQNY